MYDFEKLIERVSVCFKCSRELAEKLIKSAENNKDIDAFMVMVGYKYE